MGAGKRGWSRGRILVVGICLCVAAVAILTAATSSDEPPGDVDLASMTSVIQKWYQARLVPWPADSYDKSEYSESTAAAVKQGYLDVVREVGTDEFKKSMIGTYDVARYMESQRQEAPDQALIRFECQVVESDFLTYTEDGDAVVRVKVWDGCTLGTIDAKTAQVASVRKWDETPVWDVRMRRTPEGWKIVSLTQRETSDDLDIDAYGPDTPHANTVVPEDAAEPN
jgi:hypothetical protein